MVFASTTALSQDDAAGPVKGGEQVGNPGVDAAGTAGSLAVHSDNPPGAANGRAGRRPGRHTLVHHFRVHR